MEIALGDDDGVGLALVFPSDESEERLEYTMRWRTYAGMRTDTLFPLLSQPRIALGGTSAEPNFDYSETTLLWPLMYAIFKEHIEFFKVGFPT